MRTFMVARLFAVLALLALSASAQDDMGDYPLKEEQCEEFGDCLNACVKKLPENRQFTEILDCSDQCAATHCKEVIVENPDSILGSRPSPTPAPAPPPQQQQQQQQQRQPPAPAPAEPLRASATTGGGRKIPSFNSAASPSPKVPSFSSTAGSASSKPVLGANLLPGGANGLKLKACHPNIGNALFSSLDKNAGRALDLYGDWGRDEQELMGQILRAGDYVVDVGSMYGTLSMHLARKVGPTGRVYAIEAQRHLHHMSAANAVLNGLDNMYAVHKAIGATEGQIAVPSQNFNEDGCHGCTRLDTTNYVGESVDMTTIDAMRLLRCRLIKADVEGMEMDVLKGAVSTIKSFKPAVFVRAHYDVATNTLSANTQKLARFMQNELNYDMYWHFSRRFVPDNHFGSKENVFGDDQDLFILAVPHSKDAKIEGLEPVEVPPEA